MTTRCLDCATLISRGSRCKACAATVRALRGGNGWEEQRQRRATIEAQGRRCANCGVMTTDEDGPTKTEADHVNPVANGGGRRQILCRRCNRAKGASIGQGGVEISGRHDAPRESAILRDAGAK